MNGWRDEYTQFEWLQMGMLLVGMPVAAVVGALLGMVGRWKQGRVLTAALVGMGGAAFVSVALFLLFLAVPYMAGDGRRFMLLELYDSTFSQWLAAKALIATGSISMLAAVGLRLRERDKRSGAVALSMRQLMLLQLFSFIALGCWTGMRFIALDSVSGYERALQKWSKHDWVMAGNEEGSPFSLTRKYWGPKKADYAAENLLLKTAAAEPWLQELNLVAIAKPNAFDFGVLCDSRKLKVMALSFDGANVDQSTIDQLGAISTLQSLRIEGGIFTAGDLSPLAKSSKLNDLAFVGSIFDSSAFNKLSSNSTLRQLTLFDVALNGADPLSFPTSLIGLNISANSQYWLEAENLQKLQQLRYLRLVFPRIKEEDIKAISMLQHLETLELQEVAAPEFLECLMANSELRQLSFHGPLTVDHHYKYRQLLMLLAEHPKLERIDCPSQLLYDGAGPKISDLRRRLSEEERSTLIAYQRQRLDLIRNAARDRAMLFQSRIDFRRDELKLGKLTIYFDDIRPAMVASSASVESLDPEEDLEGE